MITCPNRNLKSWIDLVEARGENMSYMLWNKYSGIVPESEYSISPVNALPKAVEILASDKAKALFAKGSKSMWPLTKILGELQIPKNQIDLILSTGKTTPEDIIMDLLTNYSYTIEINTAKQKKGEYDETDLDNFDPDYRQQNTSTGNENAQYYSNLTVPGGTNYTENEIATPAITPSIKGHAQFASDNGLMWSRTDERVKYEEQDIDNLLKIMENSKILQIKCS